jgi:hypothetical protein
MQHNKHTQLAVRKKMKHEFGCHSNFLFTYMEDLSKPLMIFTIPVSLMLLKGIKLYDLKLL